MIEAMKLGFADTCHHVADPAHMRVTAEAMPDPAYLARPARTITPGKAAIHKHGAPETGGTVYLATADESGMMVSFIQSNFRGFGSGGVVPAYGIALQNRVPVF